MYVFIAVFLNSFLENILDISCDIQIKIMYINAYSLNPTYSISLDTYSKFIIFIFTRYIIPSATKYAILEFANSSISSILFTFLKVPP